MTSERCNCLKGARVEFYDTVTEKGYCRTCAMSDVTSSRNVHIQFLDTLVEHKVGEIVDCWTVGKLYEGRGEIIETSTDLKNGGTPVHPACLVQMEDGRQMWFTPICLRRRKVN